MTDIRSPDPCDHAPRALTVAFVALLVALILLAFCAPGWAQSDPEEIVEIHRSAYPTPIPPAQVPALLREIAAHLNAAGVPGGPFGLLVKTSGNRCGGYSCDIICAGQGAAQRQWDVLIASEAAATPTWSGPLPRIVVRECEIVAAAPPPVEPPACPAPPICPTCPPAVTCPPDQRAEVAALQADRLSLLAEREALLARRCEAKLFGVIPIPCRIKE
ncbi:MAG: hypothetical protein Q8Q14_05990 [Gemmatimonadales bacterium]|nr:hypothetical protein [Gemmatimonadales bacterium]